MNTNAPAQSAAIRRASQRRQQGSSRLGYEAADSSKRRKAPSQPRVIGEDAVLTSKRRDKLTANTHDMRRNFSLFAWMIRKHLDYVSQFDFHCRAKANPDHPEWDHRAFNERVEELVRWWSRPQNCHVAARHSFPRLTRLIESHRTADGDVGIILTRDGRLQPVESDLIRDPDKMEDSERWQNGVKTSVSGRALSYGIWRRTKNGKGRDFVKSVPARNMLLHGFFDRVDQTRGISPCAPSVDRFRDVKEASDYALAKAKVEQLLVLKIKTAANDGFGSHTNEGTDDEPKYNWKAGDGPQKFEMFPGDDADFLESKNPSSQFQAFVHFQADWALKGLDIPFSFLDESHTNFFGSMAAWKHYDRSCHSKRADLAEVLDRITAWRLSLFIAAGQLLLPPWMSLRDIPWEWVPRGIPWWDKAKEIRGDLAAIAAGLDNPQRIARERGTGDVMDNIDRTAEVIEHARSKGMALQFDAASLQDINFRSEAADE